MQEPYFGHKRLLNTIIPLSRSYSQKVVQQGDLEKSLVSADAAE